LLTLVGIATKYGVEAAMKRVGLWATSVVLLAGAGVLSGGVGYAEDRESNSKKTCSVATLRGTYLFAVDGIAVSGSDHLPFAAAGYEVYDGAGKVSIVISLSQNGEITRNLRVSGTYTVNRDCTSTSTLPEVNEHFDMFVAPDGSMFTFVQTDPGTVFSGSEMRGTAKRVGD
jgi:hypothetical protein